MTTEDKKNYNTICYLVAMICGVFVGAIIDKGFIWLPVGAVFGLGFTYIWLSTRAKSSFDDVEQNF
ncbi:hypothetical protein [Mucilaginibacter ginkgonis]|uniref:Uncharacterized protein n=1 Tax=Mucilaginibacter ginkgonis TaxID=2682091 RepID=A0A6I4I2A6_9SPHI|nr:hypothetical protein [Mucilaginibacter ginkgonis]QQL49416.1 hypothetical protein GO620_014760 [Mucilaginibacter ginkgonis]